VKPSPDPQERAADAPARDAGAAVVGLVRTRLELLGIELREEAVYLQRALVAGIVAAFFLGAALVLAGILVAAAFWDSHRLVALGAVVALYALAGAATLMRLRSSIHRRLPPFDTTVRELEADLRALRETSGGRGA
jgi:uncharacterized membrane protein YqjE